MFNGKLYKFQEKHEDNLLRECAKHTEMVLFAPTGSGKTVLACKFIDDYLDENPDTVFLWLCPGTGGLQKQSQESFEEVTSDIIDGDVYSFIEETEPQGNVYFINWDKINSASNIALNGGEYKDFMTRIHACKNSDIKIFMIIDEEHKYKDTANRYIANIDPIHVLRISATPITNAEYTEKIEDNEVISAGLIAKGISVNENLSSSLEENNNLDDDLMLLELADKKRKEIKKEYEKLGLDINPLVMIQFPNKNRNNEDEKALEDEWIERVKNALSDMGYTKESGFVATWVTEEHPDDKEEITKLNGQYRFLLFKQAIATGWDCPRAKILVKLRVGGTESFNIQTIGRIRRMPERKHYENALLDNCYLYTLDSKYTEGLFNSLTDSFYSYQYLKKEDSMDITLTRELLDGNDRIVENPEKIVKVVRDKILEQCDINEDGKLDRQEMETSKGYVFGTTLKTSAFEGVARTTRDITKLNKIFGGEHKINNSDDGFIVRDAKRRIARAIGIDYNISNNVLRTLFGPLDEEMTSLSPEEIEKEKEDKLLEDMSLSEFNAFLVNNRDILVELFEEIDEIDTGDLIETDMKEYEWSIPNTQYYYQHKKTESTKFFETNVFAKYGNNILVKPNRSKSEIRFEEWCEEDNSPVKWVYKNGDKGEDFFAIIYRRAFRRNHFYPDYIVETKNGDIWIIEAKGGMKEDGTSGNRDTYARQKLEALKSYCERVGNVKWGFVRENGAQLLMSNTEWDENLFNTDVWKPIEEFIKE